jgi:predicted transcriptional regulator
VIPNGDPKSPPRVDRGGYIVADGKEGDQTMPDEPPSELTTKIVAAYVRRNQVQPDQLAVLISTVHQALGGLGEPATEAVVERTPAVSIRRSVQHDRVTCLECGFTGSVLRGHLTARHGLTPDEYRTRWSLPRDHALVAPAYSARRSALAKQVGLGRDLGRGGRSRSSGDAAAPAAS